MDQKFAALVETLVPKLDQLLKMGARRPMTSSLGACRGAACISSRRLGGICMSGRSNSLRSRYGRHCLPHATYQQAAFALLLAREATGRTNASYQARADSRPGLMLDPVFAAAFVAAKERIRCMEYRYVEETDQNRQALLEIYCAVVLATPYNDFGIH